uniref:Cytochrome c oxidase subunit NDUFA4 n=2 Tax=Rhinolophus ferrumequinum TaxID=59479 RepID=A0A671EGT4_RHIFE
TLCQILVQARKHPRWIPLFVFIGARGTGAALYVMCLALFNPDVCWDKKNNPEPWNKLGPNDQHKFYSVNIDYSKLKKERPHFSMKCFTVKLLRMEVFQKPSTQFSI